MVHVHSIDTDGQLSSSRVILPEAFHKEFSISLNLGQNRHGSQAFLLVVANRNADIAFHALRHVLQLQIKVLPLI